jgi:hypothetical protein
MGRAMKVPVDEAPAGAALDAVVADCLGWKRCPGGNISHWIPPGFNMPVVRSWSTDIAAAWELVEELSPMTADGLSFALYRGSSYWKVGNIRHCAEFKESGVDGRRYMAHAETASLAITRVYLKVRSITEVEIPDES